MAKIRKVFLIIDRHNKELLSDEAYTRRSRAVQEAEECFYSDDYLIQELELVRGVVGEERQENVTEDTSEESKNADDSWSRLEDFLNNHTQGFNTRLFVEEAREKFNESKEQAEADREELTKALEELALDVKVIVESTAKGFVAGFKEGVEKRK